jgi:RNA polymerase sigma factor FliA
MRRQPLADTKPLWEQKSHGCAMARQALIDHYDYLLPKTRVRIIPNVPHKLSIDDILSEGKIALVKAVDQYDTSREVKFESYAISLIRGAMLEYLRKEDRVPRSVRTKNKRLNRAYVEVVNRTGRHDVLPGEWADELGMSIDEFYQFQSECLIYEDISLDDIRTCDDEGEADLSFLMHLPSDDDVEDTIIKAEEQQILLTCINWLPKPEKEVMELYYYGNNTLKQIAKAIQRSESRAHQLHAKALIRLRGFLNKPTTTRTTSVLERRAVNTMSPSRKAKESPTVAATLVGTNGKSAKTGYDMLENVPEPETAFPIPIDESIAQFTLLRPSSLRAAIFLLEHIPPIGGTNLKVFRLCDEHGVSYNQIFPHVRELEQLEVIGSPKKGYFVWGTKQHIEVLPGKPLHDRETVEVFPERYVGLTFQVGKRYNLEHVISHLAVKDKPSDILVRKETVLDPSPPQEELPEVIEVISKNRPMPDWLVFPVPPSYATISYDEEIASRQDYLHNLANFKTRLQALIEGVIQIEKDEKQQLQAIEANANIVAQPRQSLYDIVK